jgi:hypothetical protein
MASGDPTSVTVGPAAEGDADLTCTNRIGVAIDVALDARGAPTVAGALANPPGRVSLPGGALSASEVPDRPNTYLLTRDGRAVGTVEVTPTNGGWLLTGVETCS